MKISKISIILISLLTLGLAIFYSPHPITAQQPVKKEIQALLLIDSSGSTATSDPQNLRVEAAKFFIDYLSADGEIRGGNHQVGVANFNEEPKELVDMQLVKRIDRTLIEPTSKGATSFTNTLAYAQKEFPPKNDRTAQVMIMFTDGDPAKGNQNLTGAALIQHFDEVSETLHSSELQDIPLYVIDVNPEPGEAATKWQEMLGTKYIPISNTTQIFDIYQRILADLLGVEGSFQEVSNQSQYIGPYREWARLAFFKVATSTVINVSQPDQLSIKPKSVGEYYEIYDLPYPDSGNWGIEVTGAAKVWFTEERAKLTVELPTSSTLNQGETLTITAKLPYHQQETVAGLVLTATILENNQLVATVPLSDSNQTGIYKQAWPVPHTGDYTVVVQGFAQNEEISTITKTTQVNLLPLPATATSNPTLTPRPTVIPSPTPTFTPSPTPTPIPSPSTNVVDMIPYLLLIIAAIVVIGLVIKLRSRPSLNETIEQFKIATGNYGKTPQSDDSLKSSFKNMIGMKNQVQKGLIYGIDNLLNQGDKGWEGILVCFDVDDGIETKEWLRRVFTMDGYLRWICDYYHNLEPEQRSVGLIKVVHDDIKKKKRFFEIFTKDIHFSLINEKEEQRDIFILLRSYCSIKIQMENQDKEFDLSYHLSSLLNHLSDMDEKRTYREYLTNLVGFFGYLSNAIKSNILLGKNPFELNESQERILTELVGSDLALQVKKLGEVALIPVENDFLRELKGLQSKLNDQDNIFALYLNATIEKFDQRVKLLEPPVLKQGDYQLVYIDNQYWIYVYLKNTDSKMDVTNLKIKDTEVKNEKANDEMRQIVTRPSNSDIPEIILLSGKYLEPKESVAIPADRKVELIIKVDKFFTAQNMNSSVKGNIQLTYDCLLKHVPDFSIKFTLTHLPLLTASRPFKYELSSDTLLDKFFKNTDPFQQTSSKLKSLLTPNLDYYVFGLPGCGELIKFLISKIDNYPEYSYLGVNDLTLVFSQNPQDKDLSDQITTTASDAKIQIIDQPSLFTRKEKQEELNIALGKIERNYIFVTFNSPKLAVKVGERKVETLQMPSVLELIEKLWTFLLREFNQESLVLDPVLLRIALEQTGGHFTLIKLLIDILCEERQKKSGYIGSQTNRDIVEKVTQKLSWLDHKHNFTMDTKLPEYQLLQNLWREYFSDGYERVVSIYLLESRAESLLNSIPITSTSTPIDQLKDLLNNLVDRRIIEWSFGYYSFANLLLWYKFSLEWKNVQ